VGSRMRRAALAAALAMLVLPAWTLVGSSETTPAPGDQERPALAFDGTNYLVVWHQGQLGATDVFGARVTPAGVVLDDGGFVISSAPTAQGLPSIAFGSVSHPVYLVVWTDFRNGLNAAYGARVRPDGVVLDPNGIPIADQPGFARVLPAASRSTASTFSFPGGGRG
jgi:hypothetical protein